MAERGMHPLLMWWEEGVIPSGEPGRDLCLHNET